PSVNLDNFQRSQATAQRRNAQQTVAGRIAETFHMVLAPVQATPPGGAEWSTAKVAGNDPLAVRAAKKLRHGAHLIPRLAPTSLRLELDKIPLWPGDHVEIRQLLEDFARYPYLPRLTNPSVLMEAIREGVRSMMWR